MPDIKKPTFDFSRFDKPKSKANSERATLIEPFVTKLNASRVAAGYKPYTAGFVGSKMSHIATNELHAFYQKLSKTDGFCQLWHYYCVPKKKSVEK